MTDRDAQKWCPVHKCPIHYCSCSGPAYGTAPASGELPEPERYHWCSSGMQHDIPSFNGEVLPIDARQQFVKSDHHDALAAEAEGLRGELQQSQDIRADLTTMLELLAKNLGVEGEPHQSFNERLLEESSRLTQRLAEAYACIEKGRLICGDYPVSKWEREHAAPIAASRGQT